MDIIIMGKPYEIEISFRRLLKNGEVSESMDYDEQMELVEHLDNIFEQASNYATYIADHDKYFNKTMKHKAHELKGFFYNISKGTFEIVD